MVMKLKIQFVVRYAFLGHIQDIHAADEASVVKPKQKGDFPVDLRYWTLDRYSSQLSTYNLVSCTSG